MIDKIYDVLTNKDHAGTAFLAGDTFATLGAIMVSPHLDFMPLLSKVILAFVTGMVGGTAGLVAKDLYEAGKLRWNNRKKSK